MLSKKLKNPSDRIRVRVWMLIEMCKVSIGVIFVLLYHPWGQFLLFFGRYVGVIDQHVSQVGKDRLAAVRAGIAVNVRPDIVNRDNVLRPVAADKADIGAVKNVVIITAAGLGYLGGAGFAADAVIGTEIKVGKAFQAVLLYDVFHQRLHILPDFGRYDVPLQYLRPGFGGLAIRIRHFVDQVRLVIGASVQYGGVGGGHLQSRNLDGLAERGIGVRQVDSSAVILRLGHCDVGLITLLYPRRPAKSEVVGHVIVPGGPGLGIDLAAAHLHQQPGGAGVERQVQQTGHILLPGSAVFLDVGNIKPVDHPVRRVIKGRVRFNYAQVEGRRHGQDLHAGARFDGVGNGAVLKHAGVADGLVIAGVVGRIIGHGLDPAGVGIHDDGAKTARSGLLVLLL